MIGKLKSFFEEQLHPEQPLDDREAIKRAACALMLEVSKADFHQDDDEIHRVEQLMESRFDVPAQELLMLRELSAREHEQQNSLHPFTHRVNEYCDNQEKFDLVEALWQVAWDDGVINKHEEALIRKIADLIYLPHSQFIKAKISAEQSVSSSS